MMMIGQGSLTLAYLGRLTKYITLSTYFAATLLCSRCSRQIVYKCLAT